MGTKIYGFLWPLKFPSAAIRDEVSGFRILVISMDDFLATQVSREKAWVFGGSSHGIVFCDFSKRFTRATRDSDGFYQVPYHPISFFVIDVIALDCMVRWQETSLSCLDDWGDSVGDFRFGLAYNSASQENTCVKHLLFVWWSPK